MFTDEDNKALAKAHSVADEADAIVDMNSKAWRERVACLHDLLDPIAAKMSTWGDADLEAGLLKLPAGFHRSELRVLLASRQIDAGPGGP